MPMQRKKVLWIDDEVEFLRSHIMFLETRGYSVTPVFSGDDGLKLLSDTPDEFDIVLLDEQMPGKDGLTVLVEIKDMLPDLPVVMVTKSEEEELMEKAIGRKIDGYLTKPVNPSQVLIVCKNLLHSDEIVSQQIKHSFVKSYSEVQTLLKRRLDYRGWIKLYQKLVRRELELENVDDEPIRQGHSAQKNDANKGFSSFVMSEYPDWINGEEGPRPTLSHEVLGKFIAPAVQAKEKIAFFVLDSIRMDQYVILQRLLRKQFQITNYFYTSIIPTANPYAVSALLTGSLPKELAECEPKLWSKAHKDLENSLVPLFEKGISKSLQSSAKVAFYNAGKELREPKDFVHSVAREDEIGLVYADFISLFSGSGDTDTALKEMVSSGKAFRQMTSAWFENSHLFDLMKQLSREEVTVVLTPSSGSVLSTRSTEFYGDDISHSNARFRHGNNLTCDERYGYLLGSPSRYGLPISDDASQYVLLKENYYFVNHATYHEYNDQYTNQYERGGISLEEMVLPLAVLRPKILDLDLDL